MKLANGFYTALGTPLDQEGSLLQSSFARQVRDQIDFGAAGLLVMGSMGLGVFVRDRDYVQVARTAVQAAQGRCPVFVGVTDTSVGRACDRVAALAGLKIDGVVSTPPYYYSAKTREQIRYYSELAGRSPFPVYLYDLPVAARSKITLETVRGLAGETNIRGIKTNDLPLSETLQEMAANGEFPGEFHVLYSGLDTFDVACRQGVGRNLDGMFACTGPFAQKMYQAEAAGDWPAGSFWLKKIIALRDLFAGEEIFPSFTWAMNLLGYEGSFHPDYYFLPGPDQREKIAAFLRENQLN
jgi:4-hydroxy-tetrahydrodipicolinate synthase